MALAALLFSAGAAVAADATIKWENYDGVDGTNAVVAVQGSKTFVAYCNQAGNNGRVEMYDAKGKQLPVYDLGDLNGGRVTAIAVSGSKVYVAGHYQPKGSGDEVVFVRAFSASNKGLKPLWEYTATSAFYAGNHRIGVKALGSKIVVFFNIEDSGPVQGRVIGINQKDGTEKWWTNFSAPTDLSSKVNAIAINGSQVAVAGTNRDAAGFNWFRVERYSAVNGKWSAGDGIRYGGSTVTENEALAISWSGSFIGVAGYVSPNNSTKLAFAWSIFNKGKAAFTLPLGDPIDLGSGDNRFTNVVVSGSTIYAAGYGKVTSTQNKAFLRAYNATTGAQTGEDEFHPGLRLWGEDHGPGRG